MNIPHLVSFILIAPLIGAIISGLVESKNEKLLRFIAVGSAAVTFVLSLLASFSVLNGPLTESVLWLPTLNIEYNVGVEGSSAIIVVLVTLIFLLVTLSSFGVRYGKRGYYGLILLSELMILGSVVAQDLFLFFMFWTGTIFPVYFLNAIWGDSTKEKSSTKFFFYQFFGAALILLAMFLMYFSVEPHSFNLKELAGGRFASAKVDFFGKSLSVEKLCFQLMFLGFAIRLPLVPLHSWFVQLISNAPVAVAIIVSALFLNTTVWALIRIPYTLFPNATKLSLAAISILSVINVLYCGLLALTQTNLRKILAYGSLSVVGLILFGLSTASYLSFQGALLLMMSQALFITLFLIITESLAAQKDSFEIVDSQGKTNFGGLIRKTPFAAGLFMVASLAMIGAPGFSSFTGQGMLFVGTFTNHRLLTALALLGVLLIAGYCLWSFRKIFLDNNGMPAVEVRDIVFQDRIVVLPLVILLVFGGVHPSVFLSWTDAAVKQVVAIIQAGQ